MIRRDASCHYSHGGCADDDGCIHTSGSVCNCHGRCGRQHSRGRAIRTDCLADRPNGHSATSDRGWRHTHGSDRHSHCCD